MAKNIIPKGNKVEFEDDIVTVYNSRNGKIVWHGSLDYCPFKDDFDDYGKWNEENENYDLPSGYVLVGK